MRKKRGKQAMKHRFGVIRVLTFSNWLLLALHLCIWEPEGEKNKRKHSYPEVQSNQQVLCTSTASGELGCSSRSTRRSEQGPEILLPSPPAGSRAYLQIYSSCQQEVRVYKFPGKKASIPVLCHSPVGMLPHGGVLRWVQETGMSFSHVKHPDK